MTVNEVKRRLAKIKFEAEEIDDDEAAHSEERDLWELVLIHLSASSDIAKEALKSRDIEFSRWFA